MAAYIRVSTDQQATEGAGLEHGAPASLYEGERGLESFPVVHRLAGDPVVAKLDRLTRSLLDFASILERSRRRGWSLVALDLNVDTSTPAGEMLASVVASVAQYERRLIGARTRDAMAAHKRQGARYGHPSTIPSRVRRYVRRLRRAGQPLDRIAARLNARNIPTGQGEQRWRKSSVAVVLRYGE